MKGAGARAIFSVLRDWGIEMVFTCPGSTEAAFLDASADAPEVRVVLVTHESIAVAAADGYARETGRPAVAYLHANVGLANGIAHLSAAALASSPVVVLNGLKSTMIANRGGFTTAPYMRDYVRQHVRHAAILTRADAVAEELARALRAATGEPAGPVYLGLPQDLVEADVTVDIPAAPAGDRAASRRPARGAIDGAAALLSGARALTIVAGSEIARGGGLDAIAALAQRLGAAVTIEDRRTIEAVGFRTDHVQFCGPFSADTDADVVFLAGTRSPMEFEPPRVPALPPAARVVHLSADAAEIGKVHRVDVPLAGDVRETLAELLQALPADDAHAVAGRRAFCARSRAAYRNATDAARERARDAFENVPIVPPALMQALTGILPPDATIVGDPVTSGGYLLDLLLTDCARRYHTTASGSLGWGMGAAVGVALARPNERVYAIVGDGVFQFGVQALATAAALDLDITFIIVDNASYAAVRAALKRYRDGAAGGPFPASDIGGPDVAAIARGFGVDAVRVTHLRDLAAALAPERGPALVAVRTDPAHTGPP
ncbi:MAG: thiamine pyrophosphate-binding protein [Candidatus Velthaea sp.]